MPKKPNPKLRKVDAYWSDRWNKVITVYQCRICGKDEGNTFDNKPKLERDHVCIKR